MAPINPVKRLAPELRQKRLLDSFTKRDRVRRSERHPGEWLVSSSQYDNVWYRVRHDTTARQYSCGCEWFSRTGQACRHLVRVSWESHQLQNQQRRQQASA